MGIVRFVLIAVCLLPHLKGDLATINAKPPSSSSSSSLSATISAASTAKSKEAASTFFQFSYDGDEWFDTPEGRVGHGLIIQRSPTSRARCRRCGSVIDKAALRIGMPIEDPRGGGSGVITGWQHLDCSHIEGGIHPSQAYGWDELDEEEGSKVLETLSRPPDEEDDSDPDAAAEAAPRREAPPELVAKLLPFQEEGLAWMCMQENSSHNGGILADEMGMGKTLQTISLILSYRRAQEEFGWPHAPLHGATLVVAPVSALSQWHAEILKFSRPGSLSVLLYHGPDRHDATTDILSQFDVVVTSYSVIEAEHRRWTTSKQKTQCPHCKRKFLPRTLVTHLRFFCGPDAVRSASLKKRDRAETGGAGLKRAMNTLKIGSKDAKQSMTPTPGNIFREYVSGAQSKEGAQERDTSSTPSQAGASQGSHSELSNGGIDPDDLASMDSEWWGLPPPAPPPTSPELLAAAAAAEEAESKGVVGSSGGAVGGSALHGIMWHRIILDEAHKIKARSSATSQAVYALRARKRWCLSGTPLQNRVGDLYSLVRFLEFQPWSSYFCSRQGCDCQSVEYQFGPNMRVCKQCGHSPMSHYSHFNKYILNPIKRYGNVGEGRRAMRRLRRQVLGALVLRRTKKERQEDMRLPERSISIRKVSLGEDEKDFYESIYKMSAARFDSYVEKGTLLHNYAHVFELLSRLRQACNHPYLVLHKPGSLDDDSKNEGSMHEPCGVCAKRIQHNESVVTLCRHSFHHACMSKHMSGEGGAACPRCFAPLSVDMRPGGAGFQARRDKGGASKRKQVILKFFDPDNFKSSSKLDGLVEGVQEMIAKGGKGIIFSQFTRMLDLVAHVLRAAGIQSVKVTGDMSRPARDNSLSAFRNSTGNVAVILISLKAGGEGLNLQEANHVFVVDPWWNPASEMQAIDRTHRIGQTRNVNAVRYIVKDTIEERILELQEKKQLIVSGTLDSSNEALAQLTSEDMRFLFHR